MSAPELAPLLRDLAIAWRAISAYPPGHPTSASALDRAHATLRDALDAEGDLELAAGRDGLFHGDRRFDGPTAARLAELLRRRGLAGVRFRVGADRRELEVFLRALLVDPRRTATAAPLREELARSGVAGVEVHDLDFSGLRLVDGQDETVDPALPDAGGLWERLIKRLVAGGQIPAERLASWIASGGGATGLLAALLGSAGGSAGSLPAVDGAAQPGAPWSPQDLEAALGAAAAEFVEHPGPQSGAAIGYLWDTLDPGWRIRLATDLAEAIGAVRAAGSGREELLAALPAAPAEAVRGLLTAPRAGGPDPGGERTGAIDVSALERLRRLFVSGDLDAAGDAGAAASATTVLELPRGPDAVEVSPGATELARELAETPLARALAVALSELATQRDLAPGRRSAVLDRLLLAYRKLLAGGRLRLCRELAESLARRAADGGEAAQPLAAALERMSDSASVSALVAGLAHLPEDATEQVRLLLEQLGRPGIRHLLDALAHEEDRAVRRRLLDLLAAMGPTIAPEAASMLGDSRWYVVRNMLLLLRRVGDPGSLPEVRRAAAHPDLRVRLEAIRSLFEFESSLPRELLRNAVRNRDPRIAEEAIELAGTHGFHEAVEPLVELLAESDWSGRRRALRLKAIRALGELGDGRALAGLRRFAARFAWPPVALEERRALYEVLGSFPPDARRPFVERGRRARDPEIRRMALALERADEAAPGVSERRATPGRREGR
jgi:HEAT repeat protein